MKHGNLESDKDRLKLVRAAIDDWGKGILSDWSTLYAIHIITSPKEPISKEAKEWAIKEYHKWKESEVGNTEGCGCSGYVPEDWNELLKSIGQESEE